MFHICIAYRYMFKIHATDYVSIAVKCNWMNCTLEGDNWRSGNSFLKFKIESKATFVIYVKGSNISHNIIIIRPRPIGLGLGQRGSLSIRNIRSDRQFSIVEVWREGKCLMSLSESKTISMTNIAPDYF